MNPLPGPETAEKGLLSALRAHTKWHREYIYYGIREGLLTVNSGSGSGSGNLLQLWSCCCSKTCS